MRHVHLDPKITKSTDDAFYAKHPELINPDRSRRKLTMSPEDALLRREWIAEYDRRASQVEKQPEAPPSPEPVAQCEEPKPCKIEVRANELNSALGYYHLFIVFTDESGVEYFFRGGPSANGPAGSSGLSSELGGGSSHSGSANSGQSSSPDNSNSGSNPSASADSGQEGPWGDIVTTSGEYLPGTIDWDPEAKLIEIANGPSVCGKLADLRAQMAAIDASHTRYGPLGPNSNSVVFTTLENIGYTPQVPSGVWAPGKDVPIATK